MRALRLLDRDDPHAGARCRLRFADGYATDARVFTLRRARRRPGAPRLRGSATDGRLRGRRTPRVPLIRAAQRVPHRRRVREPALRLRAAAARGGRAHRRRRRLPRWYLRQEGRGIGLYAKLEAYALQDTGLDTYEANVALGHGEDERSYVAAAQMLHGARGVADRPAQQQPRQGPSSSARCGVTVVARVPTGVHLSAANVRYLETKARRGAHTLDVAAAGVIGSRSAGALPGNRASRPLVDDDAGRARGRGLRAERAEEAVAEGAHAARAAPPGSGACRPPSPSRRSGAAPSGRGR